MQMIRSKLHKINPGAKTKIRLATVLRSSGLVLLFLLFLNSFAQAHLTKLRPFRATDTDLSGGDHICDFRRDSNNDGRPDRLGDFVSTSGTIIAEPSTYETGGWLFWIRSDACGLLIYGEQESLELGDSVEVRGWLRYTNGNYFFPETGLATLGDVAIENAGVSRIKSDCNHDPLDVDPHEFAHDPEAFAGNLVRIGFLEPGRRIYRQGEDAYVRLYYASDSLNLYIDADTGCDIDLDPSRCFVVTGIVVRMKTPPQFAPSPAWCIAPRGDQDLIAIEQHSERQATSWGMLKILFLP